MYSTPFTYERLMAPVRIARPLSREDYHAFRLIQKRIGQLAGITFRPRQHPAVSMIQWEQVARAQAEHRKTEGAFYTDGQLRRIAQNSLPASHAMPVETPVRWPTVLGKSPSLHVGFSLSNPQLVGETSAMIDALRDAGLTGLRAMGYVGPHISLGRIDGATVPPEVVTAMSDLMPQSITLEPVYVKRRSPMQ